MNRTAGTVRTQAVTFLGFDYGSKLIGVAVGSRHSGLAQEASTVKSTRAGPDWEHISRLIRDWKPQALVVGLPRNMDDSPNPMTAAAHQFGKQLGDRYNLPVHMVDERLTTVAARATLTESGVPVRRHKAKVDSFAAKAILQAFLDERSRTDLPADD